MADFCNVIILKEIKQKYNGIIYQKLAILLIINLKTLKKIYIRKICDLKFKTISLKITSLCLLSQRKIQHNL